MKLSGFVSHYKLLIRKQQAKFGVPQLRNDAEFHELLKIVTAQGYQLHMNCMNKSYRTL